MIKVAVIGAGIGQQHLDGYFALPNLFEVTTLCDLDEARAKAALESRDDVKITDNIQDVFADPDVDLVDVCLPPHLHFSISKAALEAGKHVVCEKPLVTSLADVDALTVAAQAAGKKLFPVFQYRYGLETERLHTLLDAGFGKKPTLASVETHWNRGPDYYETDWRGTWAGESGGVVLNHAIHNHDLLCTFFGPVASVSTQLATLVNDIEVEDCASISMQMKNGAIATSSITLGAADDTSRFRFIFSDLTVESGTEPYTPALSKWTYQARNPEQQAEVDRIIASVEEPLLGFAGFLKEVANDLLELPSRAVTLEDGRVSVELVSAIYKAARENRSVPIPISTEDDLYRGWLPNNDST